MKKIIAITGASAGIGLSIAKTFSKAGYPLLLMARNLKAMEALNLPNTSCLAVDVTQADAVKAAIESAETNLGEIDCLTNNAHLY